jgi:hypothetical protein
VRLLVRPSPVSVALAVCVPAFSLLFGGQTKLLQDAQIIVCFPLLNYLASFDAVHGEPLDL